jgi:membrane fusion protein (multidrug efflux system)
LPDAVAWPADAENNQRSAVEQRISTGSNICYRQSRCRILPPVVADSSNPVTKRSWARRLLQWLVPGVILLLAAGIAVLITGNWNTWASERVLQRTDDAYVRADLTPLSTKVAGLVATVAVSDYQPVKAGDLLVQLRDDDFRAQVEQAEAALLSSKSALVNNQRQKELQDARIAQAAEGIRATEAEIAAAQAGIEAAQSTIANAHSAIEATKADVERTGLERRRQEALVAAESATRQKLEQVVADERRFRAQLAGREDDLSAASAQLSSREADLARARAHSGSAKAELEAQKRQRAVLDSQELLLRADLDAKKAALSLAQINQGYARITAPAGGIVSERKVRPGQLVSPGTQVISLVQCDAWVQANYKETQLRHMRAGDPAEIRVDAYPGVVLKGKVEQVSPASGSQFALLPPDNATGNFTKIVQRIPVKIVLDAGQPDAARLRPGLSVIATVRTNALTTNGAGN